MAGGRGRTGTARAAGICRQAAGRQEVRVREVLQVEAFQCRNEEAESCRQCSEPRRHQVPWEGAVQCSAGAVPACTYAAI